MISIHFTEKEIGVLSKIDNINRSTDLVQLLREIGVDVLRCFEGDRLVGLDMRSWSIDTSVSFRGAYIENCIMTESQHELVLLSKPVKVSSIIDSGVRAMPVETTQRGNKLDNKSKEISRKNEIKQFVSHSGVSRANHGSAREALLEAEYRVDQARSERLRTLNFEDIPRLEQLPSLDDLESVVEVHLRHTKVSDISKLSAVTNLEKLDLQDTPVKDLSPLVELYKIHNLHLKGCSGFSAAPLLSIKKNLTGLNLNRCEFEDHRVIGDLTSLEWLNISHTDFNKNINRLDKLNTLYAVSSTIKGANYRRCVALHHLDIDGNSNFKNMRSMTRLNNLKYFSANNTSLWQFSRIESLRNLEVLYVSNSNIHDVTRLAQCTQLRELSIDGCKVSDISSLASCRNLVYLSINNTEIFDISVLSDLERLRRLEIRGLGTPIGLSNIEKRGVEIKR